MARKFFEDSLVGLNLEDLERFYKITTSAEVLLYVVENLESATQIFELLNDRGRKLTDLESIKSFLMYNIGKLTDNSDQIIKSIQAEFVEIYREIEAKEIDDRDVLRYHCIGFEKCPDNMREKPKEFIKAKFQGLISVGNREHAKEEIIQFSSRLRESFQIFGQILEERFNNEKLANVYMIGRVAPFYPVLMAKKKLGKESYDNALSSIRDFTFRASLASLRSNGESYFYTSLRNDQDPIEKIISFIADNQWDINKRVEDGLEYKNFYFGFPKHFLRYILVSYENLLRSKKGFPKITLREFFTDIDREKISIEHITAQRAKNVTFDDDFKVEYMNDLGNLVLDFAGSNSSKGNDNTLDKLPQYQNAPIMSQNEILDVKLNWSNIEEIKQFITDRSKRLRAFIKAELMKS